MPDRRYTLNVDVNFSDERPSFVITSGVDFDIEDVLFNEYSCLINILPKLRDIISLELQLHDALNSKVSDEDLPS